MHQGLLGSRPSLWLKTPGFLWTPSKTTILKKNTQNTLKKHLLGCTPLLRVYVRFNEKTLSGDRLKLELPWELIPKISHSCLTSMYLFSIKISGWHFRRTFSLHAHEVGVHIFSPKCTPPSVNTRCVFIRRLKYQIISNDSVFVSNYHQYIPTNAKTSTYMKIGLENVHTRHK